MANPQKPQQEELSEDDLLAEPAPDELSEADLLADEQQAAPTAPVTPPPAAPPSNPTLRAAVQDADARMEASEWQRFKDWVGRKSRAGAAGILGGYTFGGADELAGLLAAKNNIYRDALERERNPQYAAGTASPAGDFNAHYRAGRDTYRNAVDDLIGTDVANARKVRVAVREKARELGWDVNRLTPDQQVRLAQFEAQERTRVDEEGSAGTYFTGGMLGAMLLPNPVPRLGAGTSIGPIQAAARSGALSGALSGFGNSTAELADTGAENEPGRALLDTGGGAALGGALGAGIQGTAQLAGKYVPPITERFRQWLAEKAEEKAVKSVTGRNQRAWESMINNDTLHDIGRDILDEGLLDAPAWYKPLPSAGTVRERAATVAEKAGKDINKALADVDALVPEEQMPWKYDIAQDIEKRMVQPRSRMSAGDLTVEKRLQKEADQIRQHTFPNRPTLTRLEQQKRYLEPYIQFDKSPDPPPVQEGLRDLYDYLANTVEQSAWKAASEAGSDAAERFVAAKDLYGNMAAVAAPGLKQQARELSNRMLSASDHGMGATAAMLAKEAGDEPIQSGLKGLLIAAGNKLFREYGNQASAKGMNALSQSDYLRSLASVTPEALGPWGARLSQALTRGPGAFELEDYMLAQTVPEYAERRRQAFLAAGGEAPP